MSRVFRLRKVLLFVPASLALLLAGCPEPAPVSASHRIHRVVSLAPNITEMLFSLGCGSQVVGTDDFSDFPPAAAAIPKVGQMQPDLERIATIAPDAVIGLTAGSHSKLRASLDRLHIPLVIVRTEHLQDVASVMRQLGRMLNCPDTGRIVSSLAAGLQAQRRTRRKPPRVLFMAWSDPLYVAGRDTYVDDLFALTGAANAVKVTGWPQLSLETVLADSPDLVLYPRRAVSSQQVDLLRSRGVRSRFVSVDDNVFGRPGPRVVQAARELNAILDSTPMDRH